MTDLATEYPAPKRPRQHCWVYCPRVKSGVAEIVRSRLNPKIHTVCDTETETVIFRGTWKDALAFAAGELSAPFMNETR